MHPQEVSVEKGRGKSLIQKKRLTGKGMTKDKTTAGEGGLRKGDGLDGENDIQAREDKDRKRKQAV